MKYVKIDVTLLDKSRFFRSTKAAPDGHFPIYAALLLVENRGGVDRYGNSGFVTQSMTKQERDRGIKLPILGNLKELSTARKSSPAPASTEIQDDDIPF